MRAKRQHDVEAGLRALRDDMDALGGEDSFEVDDMPAGCRTALSSLDQYVADELAGRDPGSLYPALWQHLQTCEECRMQHALLLDMLRAEERGELPEIEFALPTQESQELDAGAQWDVVYEPSGAARPSLVFIFAPGYLQQRLAGPARRQMGVGERRSQYGGRILIVDSIVLTPQGEVSLRVFMEPDPAGEDLCTLCVEAVGDVQPRDVQVSLGAQAWEATLDSEGQACLGPVPVASLGEASLVRQTLRLIL